jgi:hypothetical protein
MNRAVKGFALYFLMFFTILVTNGCKKENTITFDAEIDEVDDNSILINTSEDVGFEKAQVYFEEDMEINFDLEIGQTVKLTIKPDIRESYPVQVTAVEIELIE